MAHQLQTQFINISKFIKKLNSANFLSLVIFSTSLVCLMLYSLLSSNICASVVSAMKFSFGRNHMFLLCNGILVILVKSSSSSSTSATQECNSDEPLIKVAVPDQNCQKAVKDVSELPAVELKMVYENVILRTAVQEDVIPESLVVPKCDGHEQDNNDDDDIDEYDHADDHYDDEDEEDAEELNRRCEEFIRRMKQGIISETRRQRIMV